MKNFQEMLKQPSISTWIQDVRIGLEKESQRIDDKGRLAKTDHPSVLGNRSFHETIQTDYSETQLELITPVLNSPKEAVEYLGALHEVVERSLDKDEMIWPLSMPPELPENEEEIRIAKLEKFEEVLYRRYLAKAYGKRKQMVSGIHYNFEFQTELIDSICAKLPNQSKESVRNDIYLHVAQNYLRYRWMITYLYGASPVAEVGYFTDKDAQPKHLVRSLRNSTYGYTNNPDVNVSFSSLNKYCKDIDSLVEKGILSEEKEFYAPVRLRGGKRVADLSAHGIHYLEIRNIDLNPFADYGIDVKELRFLHLYMMLMLWLEVPEKVDEEVAFGTDLNNQVALENPLSETTMVVEGVRLFDELENMANHMNLSEADRELILEQRQKFINPEKTLSGQLALLYSSGTSQHEFAVSRAVTVKEKSTIHPYQLEGFRDMELSTQIMLFDALQVGLKTEVLDRDDQFIRLSYARHSELIKNGNMTSKDNYIVPLAMANKVVTKQLLAEQGFRVPDGKSFQRFEDAQNSYNQFATRGFVVKPKSTNYGIGISIFKNGATIEDYTQALAIAFQYDSEVMVEEYLAGTEYRFCVIGGKTCAIMLRRPANVTGDGNRTIEELVAEKNTNPLRGTEHRSPLERILLSDIELLMLKEQGYSPQSVLKEGEVVYLRENSNVSTGGDSVDMTDEFDVSYKQLAEDAVASLGAEICGIDFIIPDKSLPISTESTNYGILEANFNPAMHMHAYPHSGEGRRLTMDVIRLLFPEIFDI